MHDGIAVAATKKYLFQSSTQIRIKGRVDDISAQVRQWHVRIDAMPVDVPGALGTGRIAVRSNFNLVLADAVVGEFWQALMYL